MSTTYEASAPTPAAPRDSRRAVDLLSSEPRTFVSAAKAAMGMARAYAITTIKEPRILLGPKRYILLLSHPRCYTSLIAHIIGSHPEIIGSCETYTPLRDQWDLIRLRYRIYWLNERKRVGRYFFDKILLPGIPISKTILNREDVTVLFTVRGPEQTLPSMISLGRDSRLKGMRAGGLGWELNQDPAYSCDYYIGRLRDLEQWCLEMDGRALYFEANDLIERTADVLHALSRELRLSQDLSERYETFGHTGGGPDGRVPGGDISDRIKSGRIDRSRREYPDIIVPDDLMQRARTAYEHCRSLLRERCARLEYGDGAPADPTGGGGRIP